MIPRRLLLPAAVLSTLAACSSGGGPTPPSPDPVASVQVSPASQSIAIGGTVALTATPKDANGQTVAGQTIEWSTSNAAVATVSSSGTVTGVTAGGPVTISASTGGKTGTAQISVTSVPVATVQLTAPRTTLPRGSTTQLTAETRAAGGQVLTGRTVTWSTSDPGIATVSGTGLVTAVAMGGPVTITATSEGKSGTVALTVSFPPLATGWQYRRALSITTGASAAETHYSIRVTFDHQALVSAGKSLASGNDVRIGYWNGTAWVEHDRVLDAGSTWNSGTTTLWFRIQAPIAANTVNTNYHLHYGNAAAPANPPSDPELVFLLADDFEDGTLDVWDQDGDDTWQNVNTRAHRGTRAMWHGPEGPQGRTILADDDLDERNVLVEAWWNLSSLHPDFNSAQTPRWEYGNGGYYSLLCRCLGGELGYNVASYFHPNYTDIRPATGSLQANTWMRVATAMHGSTYRVFLNGEQINTQDGLDGITTGNVGFSKFVVPPGNGLWLDDVIARRYVFPEPVSAVGAEN
jgi:hypothetical protein